MADGRILVAATSATFTFEGRKVFLAQGRTMVREGHPILEGREGLFKPLVIDFEVEQEKKQDSGSSAKQTSSRGRKPPAGRSDSAGADDSGTGPHPVS